MDQIIWRPLASSILLPSPQAYEEDELDLSEDKKRVLNFNNGTNHELACIQGCSKKKVENIVELRPYMGWGDLVSEWVVMAQVMPIFSQVVPKNLH